MVVVKTIKYRVSFPYRRYMGVGQRSLFHYRLTFCTPKEARDFAAEIRKHGPWAGEEAAWLYPKFGIDGYLEGRVEVRRVIVYTDGQKDVKIIE